MSRTHGASEGADIRERFGRAVSPRRREPGLTQERVSEHARMHRTYVAVIELGKRNVSLVNIERLARALSLPISDLFSSITSRTRGAPLNDERCLAKVVRTSTETC